MESDPPAPPAPPRRRRGVLVMLVVVAIAVVAFAVWRHQHATPARHSPPPGQVVSVARATLGDMPQELKALGTVTPDATVTVLPQLAGHLTEVAFHEGQYVEKGDFLAQIDPRPYEISRQQARAQLARDLAVLAQARSDMARYDELHARKSIAEQTWADQKYVVEQAEAAVRADEAAVAQYTLDIGYCRITAPVAGRIGLRLVDPGNYVAPTSTTGIAVITTVRPTTVVFSIAQTALAPVAARFDSGASLAVTALDSDATAVLGVGRLYAIGNQMATSTGTVALRAAFANEDDRLFANAFVNIRLLVDTLTGVVLVPTPALQSGAPGDYVYRVNDDQTVSVRRVTLGPGNGPLTVVTSGLAAGDTVVVDGLDRLTDGARVRIAPAPTDSAAPAAPGEPAVPAAATDPTAPTTPADPARPTPGAAPSTRP